MPTVPVLLCCFAAAGCCSPARCCCCASCCCAQLLTVAYHCCNSPMTILPAGSASFGSTVLSPSVRSPAGLKAQKADCTADAAAQLIVHAAAGAAASCCCCCCCCACCCCPQLLKFWLTFAQSLLSLTNYYPARWLRILWQHCFVTQCALPCWLES